MSDDLIKSVGGACGVCLIGAAGVAGGCLTWAYVVWPAMTENPDLSQLHNLGAWLITFLGPGESFISAFAGVSICAVGAVSACVACMCSAASDDKTTNPMQDHEQALQLQQATKEIHQSLISINEIQTNGGSKEDVAIAIKATTEALEKKNIVKPEEKAQFETQFTQIIEGNISAEMKANLDKNIASAKQTNPQRLASMINSSVRNSAARVTNMFSRSVNYMSHLVHKEQEEAPSHANKRTITI